ncbi:MAG: hypothetical protein PQ964_08635 [Methanobacteriaceae archaeon]|jgi:hypothetical protein
MKESENHVVDWNKLWNDALKKLPDKKDPESWDKIAPKFSQWTQRMIILKNS